MLSIIADNPFRILGVYANATTKEIHGNLNKAQAFTRVGKRIAYPTDYDLSEYNNGNQDCIERDIDSLNGAVKAIELIKDRLKAWMFWFVNQTPVDRIAFNHIASGNFDKALEIWNKMENISSLHNRMLIYLLKEDWYSAAFTAGILFSDYSVEVCSSVESTLKLAPKELLNIFFSALEDDSYRIIPQIYSGLKEKGLHNDNQKWVAVIKRLYANREIKQLTKKISESKAADRKNAQLMRSYADFYINNSNLRRISELLGEDNPEYISIASKTASEALQCAIYLFNYAINQDDVAEETLGFMKSVLAMAPYGSLARQRCEESMETVQRVVDKLPPLSVRYYHRLLQTRINAYNNEPVTISAATQFLKDCVPYLMSIQRVLGIGNGYYINMSTRVASAVVNDVIDDYNRQSNELLPKIKNASGSNRESILRQFNAILKSAVTLMYQLQSIGMDSSFKENRYQPNLDIIRQQAVSAGVTVDCVMKEHKLDTRDETAYYNTCCTTTDCYEYMRIFPGGKYTDAVKQKIEGFAFNECMSLEDLDKFVSKYPNTHADIASKREEIIVKSALTVNELRIYLSKYPNGKYRAEAKQKIDDLSFNACTTRLEFTKYLADFPNGTHRMQAMHRIDDITFFGCKSVSDYEKYLNDYPHGVHVDDAKKRIEEETLWENCRRKKSWKAYKAYLNRYPNGKYSSEARPKAKSPWESFNKWRSKNGCLFTLIIIFAIVLLIAGLAYGVTGIGYVFLGVGAIGVFCAMGGADSGCLFQLGALFVGVMCGLIGWGLLQWEYEIEQEQKAASALDELGAAPTINDYQTFITLHYDNLDIALKDEFARRYYEASLDSCYATIDNYSTGGYDSPMSGLGYLYDFMIKCTNNTYSNKAKDKYATLVDSLYSVATTTNTYDGWKSYQKSVPSDDYRDSDEKLQSCDTRWSTESQAWKTASSLNNLSAYEKYLSLYPNGKHKAQADKRVIDFSVDSVFAGDYGTLPEMEQVGYGGGSTSSVSVTNNTDYTLTLLYSGIDSKRLVLSPHATGSIKLKNGSYRISASVDAPGVRQYAGRETLSGGSYSAVYYILTTPSYIHY